MTHNISIIHKNLTLKLHFILIDLRINFIIILITTVCLLTGCVSTRGIPSHGGGKRFDEEQRILVASMQQAVANMALDGLKGKTVKIVWQAMPSTGGGSMAWGGLQNFSAGMNLSRSSYDYDYEKNLGPSYNIGQDMGGGSLGAIWTPNTGYNAYMSGTEGDANYLISEIEMKCRHETILLGNPTPEYTIFVLVDVLGMNRSRNDYFLVKKESYQASCEITYYAVEEKTGQLIFCSRRAVGGAKYFEEYNIFTGSNRVLRELIVPEASNFITEAAKITFSTKTSEPSKENSAFGQPMPLATSPKTDMSEPATILSGIPAPAGIVAPPIMSPGGGEYEGPIVKLLMICSTPDAVIHYTTDGSDPDETSPVYIQALSITTGTTLKAMATKQGWQHSEIVVATYIVRPENAIGNIFPKSVIHH
jgi:hypothetical protein